MYEVYYLKNMEWVYFGSTENIKVLDNIVYKLTMLRPNKAIMILQDGNELTCLNGTEYQYWWFKNKYVRGRSLEYDYVKSFIRKEVKSNEKNSSNNY